MCTDLKTIRKTSPVTHQTRLYVVPCGKCHECLRKKQNEFAVLAINEAIASKSLHFFTLTYRNACVPVMVSYLDEHGERVLQGFATAFCHDEVVADMQDENSVVRACVGEDSFEYCPSLRREDVRLFLKRCRVDYERETGKLMSFRYAGFGEYGSSTKRPHYHFLFYDLQPDQVVYLKSRWDEQFGYCDVREVKRINDDGSPGFVKTARYVSKYVAKDKEDFPELLAGMCEVPRRISSVGFGLKGLNMEQLKSFTNANL